jgi:hypothetical protein
MRCIDRNCDRDAVHLMILEGDARSLRWCNTLVLLSDGKKSTIIEDKGTPSLNPSLNKLNYTQYFPSARAHEDNC